MQLRRQAGEDLLRRLGKADEQNVLHAAVTTEAWTVRPRKAANRSMAGAASATGWGLPPASLHVDHRPGVRETAPAPAERSRLRSTWAKLEPDIRRLTGRRKTSRVVLGTAETGGSSRSTWENSLRPSTRSQSALNRHAWYQSSNA